jgi:hypothetical protein
LNDGEPSGAPIVRLVLSPCIRFAVAILGVHLAAAACLLAVVPGWQGLALAVLVPALGACSARDRALLRGARAARAVEILRSGEARLVFADGATRAAEAVRGIGVNRHWVALKCGSPARRGMLVTGGMLAPGPFRLLRLWALWGRVPGMAAGQHPAA